MELFAAYTPAHSELNSIMDPKPAPQLKAKLGRKYIPVNERMNIFQEGVEVGKYT